MTCRPRSSPRAPTSGWPSTATPTGASSSTSAAHSSRPSALTGLIAARELAKHPGSAIIHNLITSAAVPEVIRENGGIPVRTRVGHSFIKARMAETGAVFGGEHSGHFYFRDFWNADSGMLAALHTIAALGGSPEGTTLSVHAGALRALRGQRGDQLRGRRRIRCHERGSAQPSRTSPA